MQSNRKLLTLLVKRKQVECHEVENGLEAVTSIEANINLYDIVFMDNCMPEMVRTYGWMDGCEDIS